MRESARGVTLEVDPAVLKAVVDSLERSRASTDGAVRMDWGHWSLLLDVLTSAMSADPGPPNKDLRDIVTKAFVPLWSKGPITVAKFRARINREFNRYQSLEPCDFVVLTSLRCRLPKTPVRRTIDGVSLVLGRRVPSGFDRAGLANMIGKFAPAGTGLGQTIVRATVNARSPSAAMDRALDAIDVTRGFWNLAENLETQPHHPPPQHEPINQVRLGPAHTVHLPDGQLAGKLLWFETIDAQSQRAASTQFDWPRALETERNGRTTLRNLPYGEWVAQGLRRYARALDTQVTDVAFARLWSLLEYLTVTPPNEGYDETIKRTLSVSVDKGGAKFELEYLRRSRNRLVHEDDAGIVAQNALWRLKWYVENLLCFYFLDIAREFASPQEAGDFLRLPKDSTALKARIKELQTQFTRAQYDIAQAERALSQIDSQA